MIRIAVAEDNEKEAGHLISCLKRYEKEKGETFLVESFRDGLDLIENYSGLYQIIFLDIQMKWLDGMETARYPALAGKLLDECIIRHDQDSAGSGGSHDPFPIHENTGGTGASKTDGCRHTNHGYTTSTASGFYRDQLLYQSSMS